MNSPSCLFADALRLKRFFFNLLNSRLEVKRILFVANIKASTLAPFFSSGKMMVFLVFITYILLGNTITAEKVFIAIGLFNPVRLVMHLFIPFAIQMMAESRVTLKRIQVYNT